MKTIKPQIKKTYKVFVVLLLCISIVFVAFSPILALFNKGAKSTVIANAAVTPTIYWGINDDTGAAYISSTDIVNTCTRTGNFPSNQKLSGAPWGSYAYSVTFESPVAPEKTSYWFAFNYYITEINNLDYLDFSNVDDASFMFYGLSNLPELDVSHFNTANLVNARRMLDSVKKPKRFDLSNWRTPKLEDAYCMFYNCDMDYLDISNFDFSNCTEATGFIERQGYKFEIKISDSVATSPLKPLYMMITLYDEEGNEYDVANQTLPKGGSYYITRPHVHKWALTATLTPPTCENDGTGEYVCQDTTCGKSKTDAIPATGHTEVVDSAVAPTCTQTGKTEGKHCSVCGAVTVAQTEVPSTGHSWGGWTTVTSATEDSKGLERRECSVCHDTETRDIPALEHTHKFVNWLDEISANCTQSGTKGHYLCSCGKYFDKSHNEIADVIIPANGHNEVIDSAVAPTCTRAGLTEGRHCTECDYKVPQTEIPALGHSWGGWTTVTAATEDSKGLERRECSVCHEAETRDIPALSHTHKYENWVDEAPASCTQNGTKGHYLCSCGKYFDESHNEIADVIIRATGHTAGEAATCTSAQVCTVCGTELNPAKGHSHEWQITKKPTKDETGLKQNICTACGDIDGEEVIAKLVSDDGGNGDVIDLEPGKEYDLDIEVRETNEEYSLEGVNKGYAVKLWVVEGENKQPYDSNRLVTLSLVLPEGMESDNFKLYKRLLGGEYELIEGFAINGRMVTVRTTLSAEFVFNAPAPEKSSGIPVWVWAIIAAVIAILIIIIVIILIKKKGGNGGTPVAAAAPAATTTVIKEGTQYDDAALKAQLAAQSKKLDELMERETPAGALEKGLSDEEMRSYFTDGEIISMVNAGKLSREDGNRIISGRKK